MKSTDKFVLVLVASLSLLFAGCGGGGGSSSNEIDVPPPVDPVTPVDPPGPSQAEIDARAMKLGAAIGLDEDGDPVSVTAGLPTGVTPDMGKIATGMMDNDFKVSSMAVASIDGWDSDATTRTMTARTTESVDTIVLYSNVDDPTDEYYDTYFGSGGAGTDLGGDSTAEIASAPTADGALAFNSGGFTASKTNAGKFMFDGFNADPNTSFELAATNDPETAGNDTERTGSFFGIPGKYACPGCLVRVNAVGALVVSGGDMIFTPDEYTAGTTGDAATLVEGVISDPDFLVFGYWLEGATKDGKETYKFSPYAMGELGYGDSGNTVTGTVQGKAVYEGPATGMYLQKTLTTDGGIVTGGSPFSTGQFTAMATLTAYFGGADVATNDQNTISGTISDFMDGDTSINDGWELKLNKSLIDTSTGAWALTAVSATTPDSQRTTSGNGMHAGAWTATFHGSTETDETNSPSPGSVAGTFNGHFQDGHVAGSFGAIKQKQ